MIRFPSYPAHVLHFGPARAKAEVWRLAAGLVIAVFVYFLLTQIYGVLIYQLCGPVPTILEDMQTGATPLAMYVVLFSFGLITIATGLVVRFLHQRPLRSILGPLSLAVPQFTVVLVMVAVLSLAIGLLPPWNLGEPYVANMALSRWMLLLPLSLMAVFVQTSAEEVFFRGYIQQQLAARFSSPLIWMIIPSVIFGLGHYSPSSAGSNAAMIAVWAVIFGALMADLTARSGSLGPAIAVHFANNVLALLVTSMPSDLSGLALYHTPFGMNDEAALRAWLPVDFVAIIVTWLAARLALRR